MDFGIWQNGRIPAKLNSNPTHKSCKWKWKSFNVGYVRSAILNFKSNQKFVICLLQSSEVLILKEFGKKNKKLNPPFWISKSDLRMGGFLRHLIRTELMNRANENGKSFNVSHFRFDILNSKFNNRFLMCSLNDLRYQIWATSMDKY